MPTLARAAGARHISVTFLHSRSAAVQPIRTEGFLWHDHLESGMRAPPAEALGQCHCDASRGESATMQTQIIYANLSETVTIVCEQCGHSKVFKTAAVKDLPRPLKVRCPCGATFEVNITVRQFYRKKTRLPGTYVKSDPQTRTRLEQDAIIVEDLSRTGLRFRTLGKHTIQVNDVLAITFTLDDARKTDIRKAVRVRRIDDRLIGAEFLDHDAYTETNRMLGFYFMPH
jgi:hypothetical protein